MIDNKERVVDGRPDTPEQLAADWAEARWRVAALLKAMLDPGTPESVEVRANVLLALARGTMDQFTAFVETLSYLHLVLLTEDSTCDRDEVVGTLQRITDPAMDSIFQRLHDGDRVFYAERPLSGDEDGTAP